MTLTDNVTRKIIYNLINGQDYRIEIITLLDATFLEYAIEFFKKVVDAKLKNENITVDWYKRELLDPNLPKENIAINSGLNIKTITNMYNTSRKEIVIEASIKHYDTLYQAIKSLVENNDEINITLTIKFRNVSVELDINESLIVINTLAVKRAALRGGLWSTAGKQVEKNLMKALCMLFNVPSEHYEQVHLPESLREVDFFLVGNKPDEKYKCEVKLMGRGNPEAADAVIARDSKVFVADKLSDLNKSQLTNLGVEWVELRSEKGYRRFLTVLKNLNIPCEDFTGDIDSRLEEILDKIFERNSYLLSGC